MSFNIKTKKILSEDNCKRIIALGISLRDQLENAEKGLISDYDSTQTYTRGQAVYYDNYLYKCLYTTTGTWDSTKWQKIGDELDLITKQDIEAMLGLTQEEIETLQKIINDSQITLSTTFSSSRIYSDIQQCLSDSKAFTLSKLASTMTASFEIATSIADITESNILYLLSTGANTYDIYALIDGTPTDIGCTKIDLSQFYTKTEIDNDFVKKTDADGKYALITTVDNHINDTVAHITQSEKDSYALKSSITDTIDSTSTSTDIASAKSVWDSLYKIRDPQILVDANKPTSIICEAGLATLNTPSKEGLTIAQASLIISANDRDCWNGQISITVAEPSVYVRSVNASSTWTKWQRLCSTSVEDVPVTNIAPADTTTFVGFKDNTICNYCVRNGICFVSIWGVQIASTGKTIRTGVHLPKSSICRGGTMMTGNGDATCHAYAYIIADTGELCFDVKDANIYLYGSFSYPVAES